MNHKLRPSLLVGGGIGLNRGSSCEPGERERKRELMRMRMGYGRRIRRESGGRVLVREMCLVMRSRIGVVELDKGKGNRPLLVAWVDIVQSQIERDRERDRKSSLRVCMFVCSNFDSLEGISIDLFGNERMI